MLLGKAISRDGSIQISCRNKCFKFFIDNQNGFFEFDHKAKFHIMKKEHINWETRSIVACLACFTQVMYCERKVLG